MAQGWCRRKPVASSTEAGKLPVEGCIRLNLGIELGCFETAIEAVHDAERFREFAFSGKPLR